MNFKLKTEEKLNISDISIDENCKNVSNNNNLNVNKVLRVLKYVKLHLDSSLASRDLIKGLSWAINKIESNSLYTISLEDEYTEYEDIMYNPEKKEFLENFQDYNLVNLINKQSRERVICKTAHNHSDFNVLKNMRENLRNKKFMSKVSEEDEYDSPKIKNKNINHNNCLSNKKRSTTNLDDFINNKYYNSNNVSSKKDIENGNVYSSSSISSTRKDDFLNNFNNNNNSNNNSNNKNKNKNKNNKNCSLKLIINNSYLKSNLYETNNMQDIKYNTDVKNLNYVPKIISDKELINYSIKDIKSINNTNIDTNNCAYKSTSILSNNNDFNMNSIISREFNIFNFESKFGRDKSFVLIGKEAIRSLDLNHIIDTTRLESFLYDIKNQYLSTNPYHNERHGADVGQTASTYLKESEVIDICYLQDLDILSVVIASICHDVGHPGMNNTFQINSQSEAALTYHDKSVLENYHIYLLFNTLKKQECNILISFFNFDIEENFNNFKLNEEDKIIIKKKKEDYNIFRRRIIESILATDMFFHSKVLNDVNTKLMLYKDNKKINQDEVLIDPNSKKLFEDQQDVINLLIHSADISHNTKPFILSQKWTEYLTDEFHNQGDIEMMLNLNVSFLCDRNTTNVPKGQIGFISFVIIPTFEVLADAFPSLSYLVDNAKSNLEEWKIKLKQNEEI